MPCAARADVDGLLGELAGALGAGHDHRRRAVVLLAAVEEPERLDDPARVEVVVLRQLAAVADRARVALRVRVAGERDLGQGVLGDVVLVHEALRDHRVPVGRHHHPVGDAEGALLRDPHPAGHARLSEAPVLPLREAAIADDVVRVARGDRRIRDRERAGHTVAPAVPGQRGEARLLDAEHRRELRWRAAIVGVGDEAVDRLDVDAGVHRCVGDRRDRELQLAVGGAARPVVDRLAHADDR